MTTQYFGRDTTGGAYGTRLQTPVFVKTGDTLNGSPVFQKLEDYIRYTLGYTNSWQFATISEFYIPIDASATNNPSQDQKDILSLAYQWTEANIPSGTSFKFGSAADRPSSGLFMETSQPGKEMFVGEWINTYSPSTNWNLSDGNAYHTGNYAFGPIETIDVYIGIASDTYYTTGATYVNTSSTGYAHESIYNNLKVRKFYNTDGVSFRFPAPLNYNTGADWYFLITYTDTYPVPGFSVDRGGSWMVDFTSSSGGSGGSSGSSSCSAWDDSQGVTDWVSGPVNNTDYYYVMPPSTFSSGGFQAQVGLQQDGNGFYHLETDPAQALGVFQNSTLANIIGAVKHMWAVTPAITAQDPYYVLTQGLNGFLVMGYPLSKLSNAQNEANSFYNGGYRVVTIGFCGPAGSDVISATDIGGTNVSGGSSSGGGSSGGTPTIVTSASPITPPTQPNFTATGGSIILKTGIAPAFSVTAPTYDEFENSGTSVTTASTDPFSYTDLTLNVLNRVFYYLRDIAGNVINIGSIDVYPDTDGPEITSVNLTFNKAQPYSVDFSNPEVVSVAATFNMRDIGVGIKEWAFDVGDGVLSYRTDQITNAPDTQYTLAASKNFTILPYVISPINVPAQVTTVSPQHNTNTLLEVKDDITIDWSDDLYGYEYALKFVLEYELEGFQWPNSDPSLVEFPELCTLDVTYTNGSTTTTIFSDDLQRIGPGPAQDPSALIQVDNINPIELFVFRTNSNELTGTLTAKLSLKAGPLHPATSIAYGSYNLRFIEKQVAIDDKYPIFIRAKDEFDNYSFHKATIDIDKNPFIYFFDITSGEVNNLGGNYYTNLDNIDVRLSYVSGSRIVRREILLVNKLNGVIHSLSNSTPNNFFESEEIVTLNLVGKEGAFTLRLEIEDNAGKVSIEEVNLNRNTVKPIVSAVVNPTAPKNSSGQVTSDFADILVTVSNENTVYSPLWKSRATLSSTPPSIDSLKLSPIDLLLNSNRPFYTNTVVFAEKPQPSLQVIYIHVMDVCGNITTFTLNLMTNSSSLVPIGNLKSTAKVLYKDSTSADEYQLMNKPVPRLVNTNDPGLTDNGRVLQLNKGEMLWAPYFGGILASQVTYTPKAPAVVGTIVNTQRMKYYLNRRPSKITSYMDTEYVDYDVSNSKEDIGDIARAKNDDIIFDDRISDGTQTLIIGDIS